MGENVATLTDWLNVRITAEEKAELERLAKEGDRTVAAEIRRAIRSHLEGEKAA